MNFGRGFSIPQENDVQIRGPWTPVKPEKPIPLRSNPIPIEREGNQVGGDQLGRENWEELVGIYSGFLQEDTNNNGAISNSKPIGLNGQNGSSYNWDFPPSEKVILNHNVGSCTHNFGNDNAAWNNNPLAELLGIKNQVSMSVSVASGNGMPSKSVHVTNRSTIPNSNAQVDRNWEGSNSTNRLLANRNCTLDSNGQINGHRFLPMHKEGFAAPYRPSYNLNSPPRSEASAAPSLTSSLPFAPVTPDQVKQFENQCRSRIPSFSVDESSSQEKDKQKNLFASIGSEVIENQCDELLQNIVDSSSAAISLPLKEKNKLCNGGDLGIDLNTTPQQKLPKRRKHRPKVIVEGKPKRAPKSTTPKNISSRENPSGKRKYVRKNGLQASVGQNPDVVNEVTVPNAESAAKSCRRELNFDLAQGKSASHWAEMNQEKSEAFNLNLDSKDTGLCIITDNDSGVKSAMKIRTLNNTSSIVNPSGKRKYVLKNGLNVSVAQNPDAINEVTVPNAESAAKSCRRVLSFDLENGTRDKSEDKIAGHRAEIHQENSTGFNLNLDSSTGFNLNLDSQATTGLCFVTNNGSGTKSPMQTRNPTEHIEEHQQAGTTSTFNHSENPIPSRCISLPERCASAAPTTATIDHTSNAITRSVNMKIPISFQSSGTYGHNQVHQQTHGEVDKIVFQANTSHQNLERTRQVMWPSTPQLISRNVENSDENRGSKREYCDNREQTRSCAENLMGSQLLCTQIYRVDGYSSNGSVFGTDCPETHKRKKSENGFHDSISGTPFTSSIKDCFREGEKGGGNGIYTNSSRSQIDRRILDSYFGSDRSSKKLNYGVKTDNNSQKQVVSSRLNSNAQSMAEGRFTGSTQVQDQTSHNAITNWNLLSSTQPKKSPATIACDPNISAKKLSSTDKVCLQEHKSVLHGYQQTSMNARDLPENRKCQVQIDYLIYRLKRLGINDGSNEIVVKEKNALVPHKGAGTIVPYEGFDIKKRKTRPKVDLDLETNRVWNLLMWKEGSECFEGQSKDKEKWWEEERKVFRGRADSFIARMHLVQGDRRFSRWKGSVVDSVIGVFLTQNVSDHLSSSAFMSLASRFPLLSTTTKQTWYQTGKSILIEEPVVQTPEAECNRRITRQPFHNGSSVACHELTEHGKDNLISIAERTSLLSEHNRRAEKELISSENSFTSVSLQPNGKIRSIFVSNSEAQDPTTGYRPNNFCGPTSSNLLHTQKTIPFQEFNSHEKGTLLIGRSKNGSENTDKQIPSLDKVDKLRGSSMFTHPINANNPNMGRPIYPASDFQLHMTANSQIPEVNSFGLLGEQRMSSLSPSAYGITKSNGLHHMSKRVIHMAETTNNTTVQQNGVPKIQAPTLSPYSLLSNSLRPVPQTAKDQLFISTHQQQSTEAKEPREPAEPLIIMQIGKRQQITNDPKLTGSTIGVKDTISIAEKKKWLENKIAEVNSKEQVSSSVEAPSGISPNLSNTKKRKAQEEKTKLFDWDTLRKKVQPNGMRKQRGKDAMDSMDYEALRCANVNEISDAIKERGMNNLLADRIKDFLNRLVREHGSIDLEWLRDVPPDKAKEFLLSIRGLGLKSVECVRLLTLHHLAFPVDTNVGRIAVRLGWVPLQPLPEELQLHLLELYPMLESIQKYLWPRLCKLDQRTLYELHYQMITFGKVFCTKSKPNCNACPMRAECRHFASAFASARLALPGPEEKTLVKSSIPIPTDKNPTVTINPMSLPPPEISATKEGWFVTKSCVPIVEEPTTPEVESTEVSESEIEDAFYEDPDEIPTIKLNIKEFTVNLHNFMQQHMELQEVDMSKALVVLNQAAASIPAPKLKNVSRLRTEHLVYELPDSHPLLNGMDRREPDDPSPYLLAIWTPDETANSVQPSERRCGSQETGKLCCENTCFSCNSIREANSLTVRGTLLIPCRTATRGSFPLNGTYFQVNEVFADHESSLNPIDIPRRWLWNLPRRTVYFGTSVSTIFKGLSTEGIQYCFWRGFVCVRGFDQKTRAPRPLMARLHFPASKLAKTKNEDNNK